MDIALGVAIPVHSHQAINSVLSDYLSGAVLRKLLLLLCLLPHSNAWEVAWEAGVLCFDNGRPESPVFAIEKSAKLISGSI